MLGLRYSTPEGDKALPLREKVTVGRDAGNDLALPHDTMVSYQHACIRQVGDTYVVEDLHSTNGTFLERGLNVTRITSPQQLLANDVIRVGSTRLALDMDVAADIPPVTSPASGSEVPPAAPEEPDVATEMLGATREGRYLPVFLEPPEESAPPPETATPDLQEAQQRIDELEQQLSALREQLTKEQGEG